MSWLDKLLDGSYMPHGHCLLWQTDLLFLHVGGDILISVSYFIIPTALVYLIRNRDDLEFDWIFIMFAAFIFFCGVTHIVEVINVWCGFYHIEGIFKLLTGIVSALTAVMVWKLMPRALSIPSRSDLLDSNEALREAEGELMEINRTLEQRIADRTRELERLAVTDELTGLANRRAVMNALNSEIERCRRYGTPLSILMIDIDDFKDFNDSYGHQVGDEVLTATSSQLHALCRNTDVVGRFGGEEFLVVLPSTDTEAAVQLAERIRQSVEAMETVSADGSNLRITCSIGVARHQEDHDQHALFRMADDALYRAKKQGRNQVVISEG